MWPISLHALPTVSSSALFIRHTSFRAHIRAYQITGTEWISLYGAEERALLGNGWYVGKAGSGAILGKRSGFLEGGIVAGIQKELAPGWSLDIGFFVGAGGGGGAPQGGGLIANPRAGLGIRSGLGTTWLELGYLSFLNGHIASPTFSVSHSIIVQVLDSE